MPSNRHSYMVLAIFCVCALAICAFLSWRNQEKKDRLSRQYAEFSMPQTSKGSTPTQQKALLEILSREQKNISQTSPHRQQAAEPPPRSQEKIFPPPTGHARVAGDESCRFRPVADPSGKDVRISKLRKELASLPEQRTRLLKQMEAIKQKALAAKQEVAGIEKSIRDVEAAVETKRTYIGKMKTLQSNTRKNEEYQMCIQEVEKTEAAIDSLETSELELMERLETAKTDMEQKIRRARDAQRELEETLARFDRTAETDKELLNHLNAERADLAAAVPENSLGEYERMTRSKGVPVIVPMDEKGHCGGCHMVITDNARMKVLGGHETVYCDSCHRILH